jgi:signal transduction histidine kinase
LKFVFLFLRFILLAAIAFFGAFLYFIIASYYIPASLIEHPLSMLFTGVAVTILFAGLVDRSLRKIIAISGYVGTKKSFRKLEKLSAVLIFEKELVPAANLFINTLADDLQLSSASLFLKREKRFVPLAYRGFTFDAFKRFALKEDSPLINVLSRRPSGMKGLGPKEPKPKEADSLSGELYRIRAAYLLPLFHEDELVGFISLGFSKGHHYPKREEIRFLRSLLTTLSAAFYILIELDDLAKKVRELPSVQSNFVQTAKYSALEQLATGIAHEIHNPLTIISGKAQVLLLKKSKNFNGKQVEAVLQTIVEQTKRASEITRKLLMFAKSGKNEQEKMDLETVLKDTLSLISYQTSLDQVHLDRDIASDVPKFFGNQGEIREIFMNLIMNAIKATPEKGRVRITLRNNIDEGRIEFCVEDTGKGLSKEELEKIFDPFYTSAHDKVGLGLYITERLVFKNGGKIYAESEPGKGSLFVVELPYEEESKDERQEVSQRPVNEVV